MEISFCISKGIYCFKWVLRRPFRQANQRCREVEAEENNQQYDCNVFAFSLSLSGQRRASLYVNNEVLDGSVFP